MTDRTVDKLDVGLVFLQLRSANDQAGPRRRRAGERSTVSAFDCEVQASASNHKVQGIDEWSTGSARGQQVRGDGT